jgi:hypothetical protein
MERTPFTSTAPDLGNSKERRKTFRARRYWSQRSNPEAVQDFPLNIIPPVLHVLSSKLLISLADI